MRKLLLVLAALAALAFAAPAAADVVYVPLPQPAPPADAQWGGGSLSIPAIYTGADASSTYFHAGNASSYAAGKLGVDCLTRHGLYWTGVGVNWGVEPDGITRYSKTLVGTKVTLYNRDYRVFCRYAATVTGTDTGSKTFNGAPLYAVGRY